MCRERTNFPEIGMGINQIKRSTDNILLEVLEWKNYSELQKQMQVAEKLELAEEKLKEALELMEATLSLVISEPVKASEEAVTISVIRKQE